MARIAKKKTWKEMRDKVFNRSQMFLGAGIILFFVAGALIVAGDGAPAEPRLVKFTLIVLGIVCFVVLAPTCFIISLRLDKKLREI